MWVPRPAVDALELVQMRGDAGVTGVEILPPNLMDMDRVPRVRTGVRGGRDLVTV